MYHVPPTENGSFRKIEVQIAGDKEHRTRDGYQPSPLD